jgi:Domain of unknown function (DUF932)
MTKYPQIDKICFPVEKVESIEVMENKATLFNTENAYAIKAYVQREGKTVEKILNFCSKQYKLLLNKSILLPLIEVMEPKFKGIIVRSTSHKESQFTVSFSPFVPTITPKTEVVRPAVFFENSYDGKLKAKAKGGIVRYLVDANGKVSVTYATYVDGLSFDYVFKHSNEFIYKMESISHLIDQYIENFSKVEEMIERMKSVEITDLTKDKLKAIVTALVKGSRYPKYLITGEDEKGKEVVAFNADTVISRVKYEMNVFDCNLNYWLLYNAMNYVLENADLKMTPKDRADIDNQIFATIAEFVPTGEDNENPIPMMILNEE